MVAAGSHQLDSPRDSENLYFIGIAGAVTIFLLLIGIAIVVIIRRYRPKIEVPVDLNEHIYDTPAHEHSKIKNNDADKRGIP